MEVCEHTCNNTFRNCQFDVNRRTKVCGSNYVFTHTLDWASTNRFWNCIFGYAHWMELSRWPSSDDRLFTSTSIIHETLHEVPKEVFGAIRFSCEDYK